MQRAITQATEVECDGPERVRAIHLVTSQKNRRNVVERRQYGLTVRVLP